MGGQKKEPKGGKGSKSANPEMVTISIAQGSATPKPPSQSIAPGVAPPPVVNAPPPPMMNAPPPPIEWFYMDFDNVQQGPTDKNGLRSLYNNGDIHDFTYVWNENMYEWGPLNAQPGILN